MIEFIRWQVRLWAADYRALVRRREDSVTWKYQTYGWRWRWLHDLVETVVSPFDPWSGYRRQPLRALLWKATHPLVTMRLASLRWALKILNRFAPYTGPGRFEALDPRAALKAEWLVANTDWADKEVGGGEYGSYWLLLVDVPWRRPPVSLESWIVNIDYYGFVGVEQFVDEDAADARFDEIERDYVNFTEAELSGQRDQIEDDLMQEERDDLYASQIERYGR